MSNVLIEQNDRNMIKEEQNDKGCIRSRYVSPKAKVINVNVQGVLCQSGGTSPYGMGGSHGDDDWK